MIQLIINPMAGNGRAKKVGEMAHAYLRNKDVNHELVYTEYAGHATELARSAAKDGMKTVIAVGGDGTVTETATGLMHTECALGILPSGTGNDFAKSLGIPHKWRHALEFLVSHPPRVIDIGISDERFFLNVCGTGFDVMVLDYALLAKKHVKGMLPYLYGVFRAIKNFTPFNMHIEIGEDIRLDGKFLICSIANGKFFGGGIPIAPQADVADGLFDIIVVDAMPRWKIPFYLPGLLTGRIMNFKISKHYRSKSVSLYAKEMRLNMDGEILSIEKVNFVCKRNALRIHW